ncbi:MAG: iron ABC transporter permease [Burkholderiales bacterium]
MSRALRLWSILTLLLLGTIAWALASGSTSIPLSDIPRLLFSPDGGAEAEILQRLRLPRVLSAVAVGALLSVAGALMQVLLRNPLADPYVLGLSSSAAAGALGMMALGASVWLVNLGAFGGALLAVVLVFTLARRELGRLDVLSVSDESPRLLLTGVMVSSLAMAVVSMILTLTPTDRLRGMLFWMLGDLSGADGAGWPWAALGIILLALAPLGRELNLLLRGPGPAQMLGVAVGRVRLVVYLVASLTAAVAVTTAGSIGFVGLVVPHALRLLIGNDQRVLLPACALAGAAFLLAADTAARTFWAPQQLPVGVLTAMVGAPSFIALLARRGGRR